MSSITLQRRARERRARAARRFKPKKIKLLLVAEAPPGALDRYFYFSDVTEQDSLYRYVVRGILKIEPARHNKAELLKGLRDRGVFLIDLKLDPADGTPLEQYVPGLVRRAKRLEPEKVILIKAPVFDKAYRALADAGLNVAPDRVPFPGTGQQRNFEQTFAKALRRAPRLRS